MYRWACTCTIYENTISIYRKTRYRIVDAACVRSKSTRICAEVWGHDVCDVWLRGRERESGPIRTRAKGECNSKLRKRNVPNEGNDQPKTGEFDVVKERETYGQGRLPEMPSFRRSRSDRCRLGPEPIGGNDGLLRADDDDDVAPEKVGGDAMICDGDGGAGTLAIYGGQRRVCSRPRGRSVWCRVLVVCACVFVYELTE